VSLSTIRIRRFSLTSEVGAEFGEEKSTSVSRGRKSASITLFIFLFDNVIVPVDFLASQPCDKPGAEKSDYQTDQRTGDGEPKRNSLA